MVGEKLTKEEERGTKYSRFPYCSHILAENLNVTARDVDVSEIYGNNMGTIWEQYGNNMGTICEQYWDNFDCRVQSALAKYNLYYN